MIERLYKKVEVGFFAYDLVIPQQLDMGVNREFHKLEDQELKSQLLQVIATSIQRLVEDDTAKVAGLSIPVAGEVKEALITTLRFNINTQNKDIVTGNVIFMEIAIEGLSTILLDAVYFKRYLKV